MRCRSLIKLKNGDEVPCGQCMACRLNYGKDWSIRIMHEAKKYDISIFLTLTYDDDNIPENGSLQKRDVQLFLKRLRRALEPREIRYYLSGEYGDKFGRPHYHVILFNVSPFEKIFHLEEKENGEYMGYCDVWPYGLVHCGQVTDDSSCYVAKYTTKKVKGKGSREFYEAHGLVPEFALMSRRPGIGADFCDKFSSELIQHQSVISKGREYKLPRYYQNRLGIKKTFREIFKLKSQRREELKELARRHGFTGDLEFFEYYLGMNREETIRKRMKG